VTGYTVCVLAMVIGGLGPGMWITARGSAVDRLVGLELVGVVSVVVPLVLAPLSVTGTLVFTRLLGSRDGSS
jgi:multicomponent Na+:H+ antiporter subunit F